MTKKLTYQGQFKSSLLLDELMAAFPSWGGVTDEGTTRLESKPDGTETYVYAPDAADEVAIQAVIDAHDPIALNIGEQKQANADDARARFLLSQLSDKTPQEIFTLMQNRMETDLREWLPLMAALIAWKVADQ
jgi:hypothetical protein